MSARTIEASRIAGAIKCMDALRKLEQSAEFSVDSDPTIAGYYGKQLADTRALVSALGPMTPEQEGIVATLAEYIHTIATTGTPNIDPGRWLPLSAMAEEDRRVMIGRVQSESDEIDAKIDAEISSLRKVVSIEDRRPTKG
ncbi:MAG: hypothetical protein FIA96_11135 [Betaproteobacteria bacterium]|nr:hypothetical protein [Betaproteobacteria bacterium]